MTTIVLIFAIVGVLTDLFLFIQLRGERETARLSREYWHTCHRGVSDQLSETAARLLKAETMLEEAINAREAAEERAAEISQRLSDIRSLSDDPNETATFSVTGTETE